MVGQPSVKVLVGETMACCRALQVVQFLRHRHSQWGEDDVRLSYSPLVHEPFVSTVRHMNCEEPGLARWAALLDPKQP